MSPSNTSISKCSNQIPTISSQVANLCEDSSLHSESRKNQTLKILHLASDSFQGGAESVFRNTIEITSKDFIIYTASCDREIKDSKKHIILDDFQNYNKIIGVLKYIFNIKNYKILLHSLDELKPDVVHTQNYLSRLSPSVLFALKIYKKHNPNVKLVFTQHGFGVCGNSCLYDYHKNQICESCIKGNQLKIAFKNCDRRGRIYSLIKALRTIFYQGLFLKEQNLFDKIIFVSDFQMQKHINDNYDKEKITVITNPIDSNFYNPNTTIYQKENLIIFFGRISKEKNISILIEAFYSLLQNKDFIDYRLLIIGNGDDKVRCEKLADNLFKNHKNKPYDFIPHLNPKELKDKLKSAKISVLPSHWYETFGLTIIESILSGVVPIASDIGALSETINKFGGLKFIPNSKDSLCEVMIEALSHYEKYFKDLKKWQEIILKETNNERYLDNIKEVYFQ